jgi:hypothetical protein
LRSLDLDQSGYLGLAATGLDEARLISLSAIGFKKKTLMMLLSIEPITTAARIVRMKIIAVLAVKVLV